MDDRPDLPPRASAPGSHPRRRLSRTLWRGAGALAVAGVSLLLAFRLGWPAIALYPEEIAERLSKALGQRVSIASLDADWEGWTTPRLTLHEVTLFDPRQGHHAHALARFASIDVRIDPLASLRSGALRPAALAVNGASLMLIRREDGSLDVQGIRDSPEARDGSDALVRLFLEHARFSMLSSRLLWVDHLQAGRTVSAVDVDLHLRSEGGRRRATLSGRFEGAGAGTFELGVDLEGDLLSSDWSGRASLRVRDLALPLIARITGLPAVPELAGRAAADLSGVWQAGRMESAHGRFDLRDASLPVGEGAAAVQAAGARITARHSAGEWQVDLSELTVRSASGDWPQSGVRLSYRPRTAGRPARLSGRFENLAVEHLLPFVAALPGTDGSWIESARRLSPSGRIEGFEFALDPHSGWSSAVMKVPFSGLTTRGAPPWPAISGAGGVLALDAGQGALEVHSGAAEGRWSGTFERPIAVSAFSGRASWFLEDGATRLHVRDLSFENPHLSGSSNGTLVWSKDDPAPVLDLAVRLDHGDLEHLPDYLPKGVMGPRLADRMAGAIHAGRIEEAELRVEGALADWPFDDGEGRTSARIRVSGVALRYAPQWPGIEDLAGELRFEGRSAAFDISAGRVHGAQLTRAALRIPDMGAREAALDLEGTFRGSTEQGVAFLRDSPLAARFREALDRVSARGPASLALRIALPLRGGGPKQVSGRFEVQDNRVDLPALAEGLRAVTGTFSFEGAALRAEQVEALYLGRPITVDVATRGPEGGLRIDIEGTTTGEHLAAHLHNAGLLARPEARHSPWLSRLHGATGWRSVIELGKPSGGDETLASVRVNSDLRGARLDFPTPFAKASSQPLPLELGLHFRPGDGRSIRVRYGDLLSSAFELDGGEPAGRRVRGAIRFGGGDAEPPREEGLSVEGTLPRLPLGTWLRWLGAGGGPDSGPRTREGLATLGRLERADLLVRELAAFGVEFGAVRIDAKADASSGWTASIGGANLQGELRIPGDSGQVRLHFDRLIVPRASAPPQGEAPGAPAPLPALPDPGALPAFRFTCAECVLADQAFGAVDVVARPVPTGVHFPSLRLQGESYESQGTGAWLVSDGVHESSVDAKVRSGDLGRFLGTFGHVGAESITGATDIELRASWPGSPFDFDLGRLDGTLHFRSTDGRLTQVKRGAIGRFFGLLMLPSLPGRLALDFRDLFQEGLAFETMQGSFSIGSGDAWTDDFVIDSPTASIALAGRTGLIEEDYDQLLTVTPKLSTSIPLVPIWLGEKLLNTQVFDRVFAYRYTVTGPWSEPRIEPVSSKAQEPERK